MAKLGYVRQHFGVISMSALSTYLMVSKAFSSLDVVLVDINEKVGLCDIAIFNGVKTYFNNVKYLNDEMITIVCGGPLQINDIGHIIPLDYEKTLSYEFNIKPINISTIKSYLKSKQRIKVSNLNLDHLLLIVDNVVTEGQLLLDYNKVTSVLNMSSRNNLRRAFVNLFIHNKFDFSPESIVSHSSEEFNSKLTTLRKKIKSSKGQILVKAVQDSLKPNANIKSIVRNSKVEEFELQFFRKMVMTENKKVHTFEPANSTSTLSSTVKSKVLRPGFIKKSRKHVRELQK